VSGFDPDAYLAEKAKAPAFDPDAYLAKAPPTREAPSRAASALAGVQNLGSFGWGDELGAALQGGLAKLTGTGEYGETYRQAVKENRRDAKAAKEAHPGFYYGAGAPAALAASMALPGIKAAQGAGLLVRALAGAGNGALQGALAGAGDSEADTAGGVLKDAAVAGTAGGVVGGALPVAGAALRGAVRGVVQQGPLVKALAKMGVDTSKLTLGQMNPEGAMAQMEEAGQHAMGSGKVIEAQREAGNQAWRDAVLHKAMAPNAPLPPGGTAEKLAGAMESFEPAYAGAKANPVTSAGPGKQSMGDQLRKAFGAAVGDENVLATDADRAAVARYLNNQASAVHFQPGESSSVGDLHAVRSAIRGKIRQTLNGANPNHAVAEMLSNAEEAIGQKMAENLSPQELAALRATDAKYSLYRTVEGAVGRAGDQQQGLMPSHLSAAVKAATNKSSYARGAGGELRDLAVAGAEALQAKSPATGVRTLMQLVPGSHYVQAPAAALANTAVLKRALLGQTRPQVAAQAVLDALSQSRAAQLAAETGRGAPLLSRQLPDLAAALLRDAPASVSPAVAATPQANRQQALAQALRGDTNL
jgi:hypothetical protein